MSVATVTLVSKDSSKVYHVDIWYLLFAVYLLGGYNYKVEFCRSNTHILML